VTTDVAQEFRTCVRRSDGERCVAVRDRFEMWSILHPDGEHGYVDDDTFWLNYRSAAATIVSPCG
jgi:hypothetical protein